MKEYLIVTVISVSHYVKNQESTVYAVDKISAYKKAKELNNKVMSGYKDDNSISHAIILVEEQEG